MICANCGRELANEKFCPGCGAPVLPSSQGQQAPSPFGHDKPKSHDTRRIIGLVMISVSTILIVLTVITTATAQTTPATGTTASATTVADPGLVEKVKLLFRDILKESADITLDAQGKVFKAIPTKAYLNDMIDLAMKGDADGIKTWNQFVGTMAGFSKDVASIMPGYAISIQDPANPDKAILIIHAAEILLNFINQ